MAESPSLELISRQLHETLDELKEVRAELVIVKKGMIDQAVMSQKLMTLQRLLVDKAGYDPDRIHDMLVGLHKETEYIISQQFGLKP